jgi:hypothetical protein
MKIIGKPILVIWLITITLLTLTSGVIYIHSDKITYVDLASSDIFYLPILFSDILTAHGSFSDWYLTPAPYIFPDFLIFTPAFLFFQKTTDQMIAYFVFQYLIFTALIYFLYRVLNLKQSTTLAVVAAATIGLLAIGYRDPFPNLFKSAFHFGVFLTGIALVALSLAYSRTNLNKNKNIIITISCICAGLVSFSDNLAIPQICVPLAITLIYFRLRERSYRAQLSWAAACLPPICAIGGSLLYGRIITHDTRVPLGFDIHLIPEHIGNLYNFFCTYAKNYPVIVLFLVLFYILSITSVFRSINIKNRPLHIITVYGLISALTTIAALLIPANFNIVPRYFIGVFIWPILITLAWIKNIDYKPIPKLTILFGSAVTITSCLLATSSYQKDHGEMHARTSKEIQCIDGALDHATGVNGIAAYWDAKFIQGLSRHKLELAQYFRDLTPHKWITTERYFKQTYDFAIIDYSDSLRSIYRLNKTHIEKINGPAQYSKKCQTHEVLIYDAGKLKITPLTEVGDSFSWQGNELPTQVGTANEDGTTTSTGDQEGLLNFGPYVQLAGGAYELTITYNLTELRDQPLGDAYWDIVVSSNGKEGILESGRLQYTSDTEKFVHRFDIGDRSTVQIRTYTKGSNIMSLTSIDLKKLK